MEDLHRGVSTGHGVVSATKGKGNVNDCLVIKADRKDVPLPAYRCEVGAKVMLQRQQCGQRRVSRVFHSRTHLYDIEAECGSLWLLVGVIIEVLEFPLSGECVHTTTALSDCRESAQVSGRLFWRVESCWIHAGNSDGEVMVQYFGGCYL